MALILIRCLAYPEAVGRDRLHLADLSLAPGCLALCVCAIIGSVSANWTHDES